MVFKYYVFKIHNMFFVHRFAAPDIMSIYGSVLQENKKHNLVLNEAVLSMMHHIVKNNKTNAIFLPIILEAFRNIIKEKNSVFDVRFQPRKLIILKYL